MTFAKRLAPIILILAASSATTAADDETISLTPLVITAQKQEDEPLDLPATFTAYTGSFLEAQGVTRYEELAPLVPGLVVQEQSPATPGINLRGITTDSGDPRSEARISLFQDGVSIGRTRAASVALFDLERIEVLKGPQGTLFGRGAEIGAVSIIQNKAQNTREGRIEGGLATENGRHAEGFYNTPVVPEKLFARAAFTWTRHDGYVTNAADSSDLQGRDTLAWRTAVRWTPTNDATVDVIFNHQHDQPPATAFKSGVIPPAGGDTSPFTFAELNRGSALRIDRTVEGATLIAKHRISSRWQLTGITGWRRYDSFEDYDGDGSRLPLLEFYEDARGRQFSQEMRLHYDNGGRFTGFVAAGWFQETGEQQVRAYTDERVLWPFFSDTFRAGLIDAGVPAPLVSAAMPTLNPLLPASHLPASFALFGMPGLPPSLQALAALAGQPLAADGTEGYVADGRTVAGDLVADGTWRANSRLSISAGLRVTRERITSGYTVNNQSSPSVLGPLLGNMPNIVFAPTGGRREASGRFTSMDGRLAAHYAFTDTLSAYASVARGHRPASLIVDAATVTPLHEEVVWNREAGLHGELASGRALWNAAVFHYDYSHFQTIIPDPLNPARAIFVDAGNATGRGAEFSFQGHVTDNLNAFLAYAWTDVRFDAADDQGRPQAYAGYTTRLTPRHTLSVGATLHHSLGRHGMFFASPTWAYKSSHYFEDDNSAHNYGLHQGGYVLVNLRAGWRSPGRRWEVTAWATNLLDKKYLLDAGNIGGSFGIPTFVPGAPRRIGLNVGLDF